MGDVFVAGFFMFQKGSYVSLSNGLFFVLLLLSVFSGNFKLFFFLPAELF